MPSLRSYVHSQRALLVGFFTGCFLVSLGYSAPGDSGPDALAQNGRLPEKPTREVISSHDAAARATRGKTAFDRGLELFDAARTYQGNRPADRAGS